MTTSLHDYRLASIAHLDAATTLLASDDEKAAAKRPSIAGYLASVSLECLLKARLLFRGGVHSDEILKVKQPAVYRALFKGATGHDIGKLAEQLRLNELLKTEGKSLQQDAVWSRLTDSARPYSLRYGTEHLSKADAAEEDRTYHLGEASETGGNGCVDQWRRDLSDGSRQRLQLFR